MTFEEWWEQRDDADGADDKVLARAAWQAAMNEARQNTRQELIVSYSGANTHD